MERHLGGWGQDCVCEYVQGGGVALVTGSTLPGCNCTIDDFRDMNAKVYTARAKWRAIGRELGVPEHDLHNIGIMYRDTARCLEEVLTRWLRAHSLEPAWRSLLAALRHLTVEEECAEGLAVGVAAEFGECRA